MTIDITDLLMEVEDAAHADLYRLRCYLRGTTPEAERERMLADALDALDELREMEYLAGGQPQDAAGG